MNLLARIEAGHSKQITMEIVNYVGNDKARLKELMELVLTADQTIAPWAAWPMSYVAADYPELFKIWVPKLLDRLMQKNIQEGLRRNILRAFEEVEVPEKYESTALNAFFAVIANPVHPPAVTAFAITAAARICKKYPELMTEFNLILEPLRQQPQPASIHVRLRRVSKL